MKQNNQVNVSFSRPDRQNYVSLSGEATLSRDKTKMEELWNPALKAWFPKGLDEPDIALLQIQATKAEYWDAPNNVIAHAVGFLKTNVLGQKPQGGEDKQLESRSRSIEVGIIVKVTNKSGEAARRTIEIRVPLPFFAT